jgi:hypothetical protein
VPSPPPSRHRSAAGPAPLGAGSENRQERDRNLGRHSRGVGWKREGCVAITEDDLLKEMKNACDPSHPNYDERIANDLEEVGLVWPPSFRQLEGESVTS